MTTTKTPLAYLAGPYTHSNPDVIEERMRIYCLCDAALMKRGIKTASPLLKHLIRGHVKSMPGDWNYWGEYSEMLIKRCDEVIVLKIDGWEESVGVAAEIELAQDLGLKVTYWDVEDLLGKDYKKHRAEDGTFLFRVSQIKDPSLRRLVIAAAFIPMVLINITMVGIASVRGLFSNVGNIFTTAARHW